ncbi:hypothetical protein ACFFX1_54720 [Dactylosporangium sucinum]|uniref:Uncharacterized protein n=1 Tax=Dactylosporangium sucinum TaxID=1424081 RepID=A0A917U2J8_9ACTN|nr:hypothetical protein [Dactylosporangium sucinum]GGM53709.1 hypothetical protein GCM10007977_064140 [Dactylosporangium sucinum]
MSLTISTADFLGLLGDTIPFAFDDDDLPAINSINLVWDGDKLHTQATDRFRMAWSSWHPDDDPERDVQGDIFNQPGSGDDPWQILIPVDDAGHLVKTYKLPVKESFAPLTLDVFDGKLTVKRHRDTGHPAITTVIEGRMMEFPDLRQALANADVVSKVDGIAFTAKLLADFAKVRPRGPFELRFTGEHSTTLVTIGERFVGAIQPVQLGDERAEAA